MHDDQVRSGGEGGGHPRHAADPRGEVLHQQGGGQPGQGRAGRGYHVSVFIYTTDPWLPAAQALVPTNLEVAAQLASSLLGCGHQDEARAAAEVVLEKVGHGT